jgi:hypothetical protein
MSNTAFYAQKFGEHQSKINFKMYLAGDVTQVVEPCKCKTLSSNPSTPKAMVSVLPSYDFFHRRYYKVMNSHTC